MTLSSPLKTVIIGAGGGSILIKYGGGISQFFTAKLNDSGAFLTAAITFQGETNSEDIDLAAAGERVDGIIIGEAFPQKINLEKDSDDTFDDDTFVRCYKPISRDLLYATTTTAEDFTKDCWVKYADGFLTVATNKNDAIARLDYGGNGLSASSATEYIVPIAWGTD